jgi:hypothetical protein
MCGHYFMSFKVIASTWFAKLQIVKRNFNIFIKKTQQI